MTELDVKLDDDDSWLWQHRQAHPADDDGLWFFQLPGDDANIQLESPTGDCPFTIEHGEMHSSNEAWEANTVEEAVQAVTEYLAQSGAG